MFQATAVNNILMEECQNISGVVILGQPSEQQRAVQRHR